MGLRYLLYTRSRIYCQQAGVWVTPTLCQDCGVFPDYCLERVSHGLLNLVVFPGFWDPQESGLSDGLVIFVFSRFPDWHFPDILVIFTFAFSVSDGSNATYFSDFDRIRCQNGATRVFHFVAFAWFPVSSRGRFRRARFLAQANSQTRADFGTENRTAPGARLHRLTQGFHIFRQKWHFGPLRARTGRYQCFFFGQKTGKNLRFLEVRSGPPK